MAQPTHLPYQPVPENDWLSESELKALTPAILLERVRALQPLIRESAAETERLRRPLDAPWNALRKTGYFYQFVPKKYGGLETHPEDFVATTLALAEADPNFAWAASFAAVHNWYLASYPIETQEMIWKGGRYLVGPDVSFPPGTVKKVPGGYIANGQWKWGSGSSHADWVFAKANIDTPNGPETTQIILPASETKLLDTWYMDGAAGTGSHDVLIDNVFIPENRLVMHADQRMGTGFAAQTYGRGVYSMPAIALLSLVAATSQVGAAKAAVRLTRERLMKHQTIGTAEARQADRPASQMRVARADIIARAAEKLLREAAREGYVLNDSPEEERMDKRIAIRADIAYAVGLAKKSIGIVCESLGSTIHHLSNPLQRLRRDVEVMQTHIVYDFDVATEQHGRALLGLPPTSTLT